MNFSSLSLSDIAVTPSGELYVIDFNNHLYRYNAQNQGLYPIAIVNPFTSSFNALLAINDEWLLAIQSNSSLSRINTQTGMPVYIGDLGYGSLGDLTYFKGHYYMISSGNKLVRFDYNHTNDVLSNIELIGVVNTNSVNKAIYGLTVIGNANCDSDSLKLLAFEFDDAFWVNPDDATCTLYCGIIAQGLIRVNGATSLEESKNQVFEKQVSAPIPNIFTPNGDGINDLFEPQEPMLGVSKCVITIFNRWGNVIFSHQFKDYFQWDGKTETGEECTDGVYYYKINLKGYCENEEAESSGFLHLVR